MALRCASILTALSQSALALNKNIRAFKALSGEESDSELALSVVARQYALLHSHGQLADVSVSDVQETSNVTDASFAKQLGERAPLDEEGYKSVAVLRSRDAMEVFAERLLVDEGLKIKDFNMFRRVIPFYNGECATQSYEALREELREATAPHACHDAWVTMARHGDIAPLNVTMPTSLISMSHPQHGDVAPLNEEGYLAVAALKSNAEMKHFIRRVAEAMELHVSKESGLSGFARYYSGVCATQSFAALTRELKSVQPVVKTTTVSYEMSANESEDHLKQRIAALMGLSPDRIQISADTGSAPDITSLKQLISDQVGVNEDRVNVMDLFNDTNATLSLLSVANKNALFPIGAAAQPEYIRIRNLVQRARDFFFRQHEAPIGEEKKIVVITVTRRVGVLALVKTTSTTKKIVHRMSLEDALKKLSEDSWLILNRAAVTMVASIPKPRGCGGGWVAPSSTK